MAVEISNIRCDRARFKAEKITIFFSPLEQIEWNNLIALEEIFRKELSLHIFLMF